MAISMLRGVLEDGGRREHGQPWTKLQKGMAEGEQKLLEFRAELGGIKRVRFWHRTPWVWENGS